MPRLAPLSTPLRRWRCPQCATRSFTTSPLHQLPVGPEHPRFIEVPEPPQQDKPYRPFIKGRLPIPRDVFADSPNKDPASDEAIAESTKRPIRQKQAVAGSREEWKQKMSEARRRNLREGLKSLRARQETSQRRTREREQAYQEEKSALQAAPEPESERLTNPSHNLDLETLFHRGPLPDPTRKARLQSKKRNITLASSAKRAERLDHIHNLYMHARTFITNPKQLDAAVDEAFGTPEKPANFGFAGSVAGAGDAGQSMWAYGRPDGVKQMLDLANRKQGRYAVSAAAVAGAGFAELNRERVTRIAERLTGGKMEEGRGAK